MLSIVLIGGFTVLGLLYLAVRDKLGYGDLESYALEIIQCVKEVVWNCSGEFITSAPLQLPSTYG